MKKRFDHRRIGQLVKDDGNQATASELDSDTVLAELLSDASGMIDSALLRGGRYTQDDLDDLVTAGGQDAKLLIRLTCDLTYGLLVQRRGYTDAELRSLAPAWETALKLLDRLAAGEMIFALDTAIAAGKPVRAVLTRRRSLLTSTRAWPDLVIRRGNPGDPDLPPN